MSQGLLYRYFASKEELYAVMIREALERMNQAARALAASPLPAREKIEAAFRTLCGDIEKHPSFARYVMLIGQAMILEDAPEELAAAMRREREVPYAAMAGIFAQGMREGSVRQGDPEEMAVVFWSLVKGLAMHKASWGEAYRAPDPGPLLELFMPNGGRETRPSGLERPD